MRTWIIGNFPTPDGLTARFSYGIVTALNEDAAAALVKQRLAALGLDVSGMTRSDISVTEWDTTIAHVHLTWG
jgi:hypothetical protein